MKPSWLDLSELERRDWLKANGQPSFRSGQIRKWYVDRRAELFQQMTDLPKELRDRLDAEFRLFTLKKAVFRLRIRIPNPKIMPLPFPYSQN